MTKHKVFHPNHLSRRKMIAGSGAALGSAALIANAANAPSANAQSHGFANADYSGKDLGPAPEFQIEQWLVGQPVSLTAKRGSVVAIDFFQLWCPMCKSFTVPLFSQWENTFRSQIDSGQLTLVGIHTVFEGHDYQTKTRLRSFIKERNLQHPVGQDMPIQGMHIPATMLAYGTRGTPEVAFVDKRGRIRFQHIGRFDPVRAEALLMSIMREV